MNAWFFRAPWWQVSLLLGAVVGSVRFVTNRFLDDDSWTESAITGALNGLVVGLVVGPLLARRNRRMREALGTDDHRVLVRAMRDARRGPVPEDPERREQARRTAVVLRDQMRRQQRWAVPLLVLLCAAPVVLALAVGDAGVLLLLLPIGVLVALVLLVPRWFERRAELLRDPAG